MKIHSSSVFGKLVEINFWFILHMDLFVIIKVNVKCFVLLNGLLALSRVMLTSLREAVRRGLHYLQDNLLIVKTHPTRCYTAILEHFCECVQELKIAVW